MSDTGKIVALVKALAPVADQETVDSAVETYLDNHPEATTTVQDGAITEAKLASALAQKVNQVTSLSDDIVDVKSAIEILNSFASDGNTIIDLGWSSGAVNAQGEIISSNSSCVSKQLKVDDISGNVLNIVATLTDGYIQRCYWKSDNSFYTGNSRYTDTTIITKENSNQYYLRLVINKNDTNKVVLTEESDFKQDYNNTEKIANGSKITLSNDVGIYRYAQFEQGNIEINGTLSAHQYKARIKNGEPISLKAGDVISLGDYAKYEFFWLRFSGGSVVANSGVWCNNDYTVQTDGDYAFIVKSRISSTTVCDPEDVETNFCVYYTKGLHASVNALEKSVYGDMPSYYDTQLSTLVSNTYTALKAAGRSKTAFIFDTDQHTNQVYPPRAPSIIKQIIKNIPMLDTVIGGGDLVSGNANKDLTYHDSLNYQKLMAFLNPKLINVYGNHDKNDGVDESARFTDQEAYVILQEQMEKNPFIKYGQNFYFYFDSPMEETRYLCANTGAYTMYVDQLAFMRDALMSTPANWHIVLITHIIANPNPDPEDPNHNAPTTLGTYVPTYAQRLLDMLDAYNARSSGTMDGADSSQDHVGTAINYDFSSCNARVEGAVAGHLHADVTRRTSGGIPILICDTSGFNTFGDYPATLGTVTETAVSVVIFDYINRKLKMFRIGRGIDITMDLDT